MPRIHAAGNVDHEERIASMVASMWFGSYSYGALPGGPLDRWNSTN